MPSVLATDAYKFSMGQVASPFQKETFVYTHRRGGPHLLPFDVKTVLQGLLPDPINADETMFLDNHGFAPTPDMVVALGSGEVEVNALAPGTWFGDGEPAFTLTGPSALVSWLEPLVVQLHWRIQMATQQTLGHPLQELVCEGERAQVAPWGITGRVVDPRRRIQQRAAALIEAVGDPRRLFEVGLRAASCLEHHFMVVQACAEAGITSTSNVLAAQQLGLTPVGTMGHEHVQRFGNDTAAFRAMVENRRQGTSLLLDTTNTLEVGLPAALEILAEHPSEGHTVRLDSGNLERQLMLVTQQFRLHGLKPRFIIEDGLTPRRISKLEDLRRSLGLPARDVLYGVGGYLVDDRPLRRSRVAAVYKLSQTGGRPTMKHAPGKISLPGRPVLLKHFDGRRVIAQAGEPVANARRLTGGARDPHPPTLPAVLSRQTRALMATLKPTQEGVRHAEYSPAHH